MACTYISLMLLVWKPSCGTCSRSWNCVLCTSCNGRNHGAERGQLVMRRHHSLCNDGSFIVTKGKGCQMALAVSCCYCQFDWLMALLIFGSSPTPTALFASCVIIRATKGRVSHSEAEEACKESIPLSLTGRNPSSCPKNYIFHSNSGGRPLCAL